MPSIFTITFSPCIDKSASVASLIPEKKLRCSQPKLEPGGGGINVARAIHKLGGAATAIYPAGGYTGQYFTALLKKEGIPLQVINSKEETRENIIIVDESTGNQFRFGMPGTRLDESEWQACLDFIASAPAVDFVVASGSLPPGVPADIYGRLARLLVPKNGKLVVDTSGEALRHAVKAGVFLIKPNLGELASLCGKEWLSPAEAKEAALSLIKENGVRYVLLSMGAEGAMFVSGEGAWTFVPPAVERRSTVGAGDSMVGGMVQSLVKGMNPEESARYAVACGTAATLNPGTELCRKEDADRLFEQVRVSAMK